MWCIQSDKLNHVITDVLHEIGIAVNSYISMVIYKIIFEKNSILKICTDEFFLSHFDLCLICIHVWFWTIHRLSPAGLSGAVNLVAN